METSEGLNISQLSLNASLNVSSHRWSSGPSSDELLVSSLIGTVLCLMFLVGSVGNVYTLLVMCRSMRSRASMYIHIVNLATADLLYLSTVPFIVYNSLVKDWSFGQAGCRVLLTLDLLTMHSSIFILTVMSTERYLAVVKPLETARGTRAHRKAVALAVWLVSFCLTLPMMIMIHLEERSFQDGSVRRLCTPTWSDEDNKVYLTILFTTSILAPGVIIGYLYISLARTYWVSQTNNLLNQEIPRSPKHKVIYLIFIIVLTYWACFLPFWIWQLFPLYSDSFRLPFNTQGYINDLVTCLTYGNSCINPFLYTLLTNSYKEYLKGRQRGSSGWPAVACRRSRNGSLKLVRRSISSGTHQGTENTVAAALKGTGGCLGV
ncbi:urotensin-2 receptor-like [Heptranchias perlo]|uniref:urotensin-2 receptor-like n=1 Tax=Heptranchias perlo TaxID=212740 RepID=UPI00355A4DC7